MPRTLILSGLTAVIVALGGYIYFGQQTATQTQQPFLAASAQEAGSEVADETDETADDATDETPIEAIEMVMGAEDAPITVIEYASFTCPHCARFHDEVYPGLVENYVDTGHIRFIMREVYFDRYGLWAGMVARCGGPLRYFGIAELLMEGQREWVAGDPADVAANLRRLGRSAGLSDDQLDVCLTNNDMAQAMLDTATAASDADQITGTPSFIIDGELYSNMGYSAFSELLDGLLETASE